MSGEVSPAAEAANRRLYEMRVRLAAERESTDRPVPNDPRPAREGTNDPSHSLSLSPSPATLHNPPVHPDAPRTPVAPPSRPLAAPPGHTTSGHATPPAGKGGIGDVSHSESVCCLATTIHQLPAHLGWGSETLTAHLRKLRITNYELRMGEGEKGRKGEGERGGEVGHASAGQDQCPTTNERLSPNSSLQTRHSSLKIYPDIALGMLREERTAAGRVWLLLRAIDAPGRGMVDVDDARAALCGKDSPMRLCGWRRLRQLLAEGEGVFWTREQGREPRRQTADDRPQQESASDCGLSSVVRRPPPDRLRLFGPATVAAALGVRRLVGRPVGVPVSALLGPIGDARAHLYAAFHSGRAKEITNYELRITNADAGPNSSLVTRQLVGRQESSLGNPIARDTLAALSGACARSQAAYERRAGIVARANIALGERVAAAEGATPAEQERAWRHGRAMFRLKDYRGRHGRPGATYLAWRLPNAFGPARGHQARPKGQQKRINRQLADLFTKGMTGNGARPIEKRFHSSAIAASRAAEREQGREGAGGHRSRAGRAGHHWPLGGAGRGGCGVWMAMEAAPCAVEITRHATARRHEASDLRRSFFGG